MPVKEKIRNYLVGWVTVMLFMPFSLGWGLTADERNTIQVYRRATQSVVNIRSVVVRHGFFSQPLPVEGMGSGVVIDPRGHIVTNDHVIRDARSIEVTLADGTQWKAKLIRRLPNLDLAILRINASKETIYPIAIGSSTKLQVGQKVLAIGNPFGLHQTLTTGVVSSKKRTILLPEGRRFEGMIQIDAAINPGNSGGALLDQEGRLIGINTIIFSPSGGNVGVGFAIPVETVKKQLPGLINRMEYIWLKDLFILILISLLIVFWIKRLFFISRT